MKVGAAPVSWGVAGPPDWGPMLGYRRVLDEMVAAGYEGTELGPPGFLPDDVEAIRAELARRGLKTIAGYVPVNMRAPEAVERALVDVRATAKKLAQLGADRIMLADEGDGRREAIAGRPAETMRSGLSDAEWRCFADGLHRAAEECAALGLVLCVHPHGGSYVENEAEIDRLLSMTDPALVKLCLDTGHVAFGGGDPLAVAERWSHRIGLVHLKDIDLERLRAGLAAGKSYGDLAKHDCFVALGDGSLDLGAIIAQLQGAGYSGWLVVEQDRVVHPEMDTLADARRNREYLRSRFGL